MKDKLQVVVVSVLVAVVCFVSFERLLDWMTQTNTRLKRIEDAMPRFDQAIQTLAGNDREIVGTIRNLHPQQGGQGNAQEGQGQENSKLQHSQAAPRGLPAGPGGGNSGAEGGQIEQDEIQTLEAR